MGTEMGIERGKEKKRLHHASAVKTVYLHVDVDHVAGKMLSSL
jgi:hypothetical protein